MSGPTSEAAASPTPITSAPARNCSRAKRSSISTTNANRSRTNAGSSKKSRSEEHTSELQSLRHLVYLHSFPTRRSSDLHPRPPAIARARSAAPSRPRTRTGPARMRGRRRNPDRKSTRLNSSHLGISYIYTLSLHDALPIYIRARPQLLAREAQLHLDHEREQVPHECGVVEEIQHQGVDAPQVRPFRNGAFNPALDHLVLADALLEQRQPLEAVVHATAAERVGDLERGELRRSEEHTSE